MPRVVLFDIDGTLLTTGGADAKAWSYAFERLHGVPADITAYSESGMTDPTVARQTFKGVLGREPEEEELAQLIMGYVMRLPEEIEASQGYRVMPGVASLLESLAIGGALLGLVTGNIEGAAHIKISRAMLNRYFAFGGYGSDSGERGLLTQAAIDRASMLHGREIDPVEVFVVGDTPRDIDAANAVDVVSVGVAHGEYSVEQLRAAGADHVLPTFEHPFPTV